MRSDQAKCSRISRGQPPIVVVTRSGMAAEGRGSVAGGQRAQRSRSQRKLSAQGLDAHCSATTRSTDHAHAVRPLDDKVVALVGIASMGGNPRSESSEPPCGLNAVGTNVRWCGQARVRPDRPASRRRGRWSIMYIMLSKRLRVPPRGLRLRRERRSSHRAAPGPSPFFPTPTPWFSRSRALSAGARPAPPARCTGASVLLRSVTSAAPAPALAAEPGRNVVAFLKRP